MTITRRTVVAAAVAIAATAPVVGLQTILSADGFGNVISGVLDRATRRQVIAFQRSRHVRPDGVVGPLTWTALDEARPRPAHPWERDVRFGDRGPDVSFLQQTLAERGHRLLDTGYFGSATSAAVIAFQKRHRLRVDAIVGPRTWDALVSSGVQRY